MPELLELPPEKIIVIPDLNPRLAFLPEAIEQLKNSINTHGILVPLLIGDLAPDLGGYPLRDGHQRLHVGMLIGLKKYPCLVVKGNGIPSLATMLATYCRYDLPAYEQYLAYGNYIKETGVSAKALAEIVGKDPAQVCRVNSLDKCIQEIKDAARAGTVNVATWNGYSKLKADEQRAKWYTKKETTSRINIPINSDTASGKVVLTGVDGLEEAEELLKAAMKAVKSAKEKSLNPKTAMALWKDLAEA